MRRRLNLLGSIVSVICLVGGIVPTCAAGPITAGWKAADIANSTTETVNLLVGDNQVAAVVPRSRIAGLIEVFSSMQKVAGEASELWIVQTDDRNPNAFATIKDGRNAVLLSLTMLDLLKDDREAWAFLFGHELAHQAKQHGAQSQNRRGLLQALSVIAALAIRAKTGVNAGSLTDLGADLVDKTYSRDQEREADRLGIQYMVDVGFDPSGAIRMQRSMLNAANTRPIPFLSTHPSNEERIANTEQVIRDLPTRTAQMRGSNSSTSSLKSESKTSENEALRRIGWTVSAIQAGYLDAVDDDKLIRGCREGMLSRVRGDARIALQVQIETTKPLLEGAEAQWRNILTGVAVAWKKIKEAYPGKVSNMELSDACQRAMVGQLDANSSYLDTEEFNELQFGESVRASIGVAIKIEGGAPIVIEAIENGPAYRAGLRTGDIIVQIDGGSTSGLALRDVVVRLRGATDSRITLKLRRDGIVDPFEVVLAREHVLMPEDVTWRSMAPGYVYLRVSTFRSSTVEKLAQAIVDSYHDNNGNVKGLILDLRSNKGGLLNAAIATAAAFLPQEALIVETKGRVKDLNRKEYASLDSAFFKKQPNYFRNMPSGIKTVPLYVLVNQTTASGAELVAAALQDHKRAKIVGIHTFGQGVIATILPLENNRSALKLTTGRFVRPSGAIVDGVGITPDVVLEEAGVAVPLDPAKDSQLIQTVRIFGG